MENDSDDGYDWQDNSNKRYELAIKTLRLRYVAEGKDVPRNEEERQVVDDYVRCTRTGNGVYEPIVNQTVGAEWIAT